MSSLENASKAENDDKVVLVSEISSSSRAFHKSNVVTTNNASELERPSKCIFRKINHFSIDFTLKA